MKKQQPELNELIIQTSESLRQTVKGELEKKRKLGQYSVIWKG